MPSSMRLSCLCISAVLAALFSLPQGSAAWAADSAEIETSLKPACGSSAKDAIAAAEKALATKSPKSQVHALACLLKRLDALNSNEKRVLNVPSSP